MKKTHLSQLFALGQGKIFNKLSPNQRGGVHVRKKSGLEPGGFAAPDSRFCWGHAFCYRVSDLCPHDGSSLFCFSSFSRFLFLATTAVFIKKAYWSTAFCNMHILNKSPIGVFSELQSYTSSCLVISHMGSYRSQLNSKSIVNMKTLKPPGQHSHSWYFLWRSTLLSVTLYAARPSWICSHIDTYRNKCRYR